MSEVWPHDRITKLRELASIPLLSAAQIGAKLGVSRHAVIGKCFRLSLALPRAGSKSPITRSGGRKPRAKQARPESGPRWTTPGGDYLPLEAHDESLFLNIPDASTQCRLLDLKPHSCRWPIGEPSAMEFCGATKRPGSSYCPHHHAHALKRRAT